MAKKYGKYIPMPISIFRQMKIGDQFVVSWCKDNNPEYQRLDNTEMIVIENDGEMVIAHFFDGDLDQWEFEYTKQFAPNQNQNEIEDSGTFTFFFLLETTTVPKTA